MTLPNETLPLPPPDSVAPRPLGRPILAWSGILLLVLALLFPRMLGSTPAEPRRAADDFLPTLLMRLQSQYIVGAAAVLPQSEPKLFAEARVLNTGSVGQRLRFVVVTGELAGPSEALTQLRQLKETLARNQIQPTPEQEALQDILARLYTDYDPQRWDAPSLSESDRQQLRTELGWHGELALAPAAGPDATARQKVMRPAYRTMVAFFAIFAAFAVLGVFGLTGLMAACALVVTGKLRSGLGGASMHGGVYAETFALWLLTMVGLNYASSFLPAANLRLLFIGGADLLSLAVLAWPVLRGIPWRQVRQDLGLVAGRMPWLEPWLGLGCYAMTIPLLVVGLLITLQLMRLQQGLQGLSGADDFGAGGLPAHPVIAIMARGDWWQRLQVLLLASVAAPLVEETMFRGVLYRHLRDASASWRIAASVGFSATVTSFIFAVIHPQGLVAVPPLMALAFGFSLAREWRGTLVPSMVAHALNNSILVVFFLIALGD